MGNNEEVVWNHGALSTLVETESCSTGTIEHERSLPIDDVATERATSRVSSSACKACGCLFPDDNASNVPLKQSPLCETLRHMRYRAFLKWYHGAHERHWGRLGVVLFCLLSGSLSVFSYHTVCSPQPSWDIVVIVYAVVLAALCVFLLFFNSALFVSRWSLRISLLFTGSAVLFFLVLLSHRIAGDYSASQPFSLLPSCDVLVYFTVSFFGLQTLNFILGLFYVLLLSRIARYYYLKSSWCVSNWRVVCCQPIQLLVPSLGKTEKERYLSLLDCYESMNGSPPTVVPQRRAPRSWFWALGQSNRSPPIDAPSSVPVSNPASTANQTTTAAVTSTCPQSNLASPGTDTEALRVSHGLRIECCRVFTFKGFWSCLSVLFEWALRLCPRATAVCSRKITESDKIAMGIGHQPISEFRKNTGYEGRRSRCRVMYIGEVDANGQPDGFGSWKDDGDHFGERLIGYWKKGLPDGPHKSREVGTGSGFMCIRIGWGNYSLSDNLLRFGVSNVECSVSGKFYRRYPLVTMLYPPAYDIDDALPPQAKNGEEDQKETVVASADDDSRDGDKAVAPSVEQHMIRNDQSLAGAFPHNSDNTALNFILEVNESDIVTPWASSVERGCSNASFRVSSFPYGTCANTPHFSDDMHSVDTPRVIRDPPEAMYQTEILHGVAVPETLPFGRGHGPNIVVGSDKAADGFYEAKRQPNLWDSPPRANRPSNRKTEGLAMRNHEAESSIADARNDMASVQVMPRESPLDNTTAFGRPLGRGFTRPWISKRARDDTSLTNRPRLFLLPRSRSVSLPSRENQSWAGPSDATAQNVAPEGLGSAFGRPVLQGRHLRRSDTSRRQASLTRSGAALRRFRRTAMTVPQQIMAGGAAATSVGAAVFRRLRKKDFESLAQYQKTRRELAWCLAQLCPHTPNFGIQPRSELIISVDQERGLCISGYISQYHLDPLRAGGVTGPGVYLGEDEPHFEDNDGATHYDGLNSVLTPDWRRERSSASFDDFLVGNCAGRKDSLPPLDCHALGKATCGSRLKTFSSPRQDPRTLAALTETNVNYCSPLTTPFGRSNSGCGDRRLLLPATDPSLKKSVHEKHGDPPSCPKQQDLGDLIITIMQRRFIASLPDIQHSSKLRESRRSLTGIQSGGSLCRCACHFSAPALFPENFMPPSTSIQKKAQDATILSSAEQRSHPLTAGMDNTYTLETRQQCSPITSNDTPQPPACNRFQHKELVTSPQAAGTNGSEEKSVGCPVRGQPTPLIEQQVYQPNTTATKLDPWDSQRGRRPPLELDPQGWICMDTAGTPEVLLYIHGYNNSHTESLQILGQMAAFGNYPNHIRLFLFSWPAGKGFWQFFSARHAAENAKTHTALFNMLRALQDDGIRGIHILCHSMGARLFLRSFSAMTKRLFQKVESDIADDVQRDTSVDALGTNQLQLLTVTFLNPEYYLEDFVREDYATLRRYCTHITIFADAKDKALEWSERFSRRPALGKNVFALWKPVVLPPTSSSLSHFSSIKQQLHFLNTLSFFHYGPSIDHSLGEDGRSKDGQRIEWLDVDVIDTTFMDQNVHNLRHSFWNLNRGIIEDIRELMVTRKRARQRTGRLDRRDGNVWVYRVAPAFLTSLFEMSI